MRARAAVTVVVALALAGCTHGSGTAAADRSSPPARTLRLGEVALDAPPAHVARLVLTPTSWKCGMGSLIGTHAEHFAKGQYCRFRLRLLADDATYVEYRADWLRLGWDTGTATQGGATPDAEAMKIARQPQEMQVGAHDVVELDVWFDIPLDAVAKRLTIGGSVVRLPDHTWPTPVKL